jgi:hypothetical protein
MYLATICDGGLQTIAHLALRVPALTVAAGISAGCYWYVKPPEPPCACGYENTVEFKHGGLHQRTCIVPKDMNERMRQCPDS